MPAYVLTGTPGSGKTAILRQLELDGFSVVEEAATDVIALRQALGDDRPWEQPGFVEQILELQLRREDQAALEAVAGSVVFFDRSPVCTLALCRHLGLTPPERLLDAVKRMSGSTWFGQVVIFVRSLGFVEATAARRISHEDALAFEATHELTYRDAGFELAEIPAGPLPERVAAVRAITGGGARR